MKLFKKIKSNTSFLTMVFIVLIAAAIRLWQLGNVPPSPNWDEVALGYNAYSILMTGKDEYGEFLPIVLRSYDDYKPGIYAYFIIPFIPLFDLTTFTVRLPSAIFGVIGVIAVYFLVRVLFVDYRHKEKLAFIASFILAISPISVQVSRIAFETNVGMVLNMLAALFFLHGLKKRWPLFLSAGCAALSLYTYQSEKVFTPLFMLALLIIYWRDFWKVPKKFIFGCIVVGIILVIPMAHYITTNPESLLRAQATSVLADKTTFLSGNVERLDLDIERGDRVGQLLDNRRFEYFKAFVSGYISHWDLNWLFVTGDLKRHHAPEMGLLYQWELPFVFFGMYLLIFSNFKRSTKLLIFTWFLLAPVPAAFTTGVPHALRTLNFLPTFQIFSALGILSFYVYISNLKAAFSVIKVKYVIFIILFGLFTFNFLYFLNQYFSQQNYFYAAEWQYGWKDAAEYVKEVENKYDKIIISSREPLDQSHMFFAFYLKYPPLDYQKTAGRKSGGFGVERSFAKYEFRWIDFETDSKIPNALLVGNSFEFPTNVGLLKTVYNFDGNPVIKIATTRNETK